MKLAPNVAADCLKLAGVPSKPARKARAKKPVPAFVARWPIELAVPTVVVSEANGKHRHEHWAVVAKRKRAQADALATVIVWTGFNNVLYRCCGSRIGPVLITWVRVGTKMLDSHDNLPVAFKALTDALSAMLGFDDGDTARVSWAYLQKKGSPGVEVRIENRISTDGG